MTEQSIRYVAISILKYGYSESVRSCILTILVSYSLFSIMWHWVIFSNNIRIDSSIIEFCWRDSLNAVVCIQIMPQYSGFIHIVLHTAFFLLTFKTRSSSVYYWSDTSICFSSTIHGSLAGDIDIVYFPIPSNHSFLYCSGLTICM